MSTLRKYSFLFATLTQKYSQIVTILKVRFYKEIDQFCCNL